MWVGFWLHYNLKIKAIETLTLPLMMHLFLYLMPMKGGMLFQVFYSKHKYGLDLSKAFSLGIMAFIILVMLAVFLGMFLTYIIPVESTEIRVALWAMATMIVGMIGTLGLVPNYHPEKTRWLKKPVLFLVAVRTQLFEQLKNWKLTFGLFSTTFISVIIQALLFWETGNALGIESAFLPILLLVLILRVVTLVRILPGNLGLQEIMVATVYAAAGFSIEDGLLIGIMTRLISVFWSALVGLPALYSNLKYFDVENEGLVQLIRKVGKPRK